VLCGGAAQNCVPLVALELTPTGTGESLKPPDEQPILCPRLFPLYYLRSLLIDSDLVQLYTKFESIKRTGGSIYEADV
jgi:hypothetical protein